MIIIKDEDIRSDEQLRKLGYSSRDIDRYKAAYSEWLRLWIEWDKAEEFKEWDKVLELEPQAEKIAKYLKYLGRHPKMIPIAELQELPRNVADNSTENDYRDRITNPATAVRAFCMYCMGGSPSLVRDCEAVTCPLWPFRTGKNPLYGKALPPIDFDVTIDPSEPEEEPEDETDNEDAD